MRRLLAVAPNPAALVAGADQHGENALHQALLERRANMELVSLLVAACPAAAAANDGFGYTPFHWAASHGHVDAVRLLFAAVPEAALVTGTDRWKGRLPLHVAAGNGRAAVLQVLLEAAPLTAAAEDERGLTPLDVCCMAVEPWSCRRDSTARLLVAAPGQQPARLLQSLRKGRPATLPLFADVATRHPLSPADWHLIPSPCPSLATALPAVLQRSPAEAALLVARLPAAEQRRLCTAALCLHRAQALAGVELPLPLVWRILTTCLV